MKKFIVISSISWLLIGIIGTFGIMHYMGYQPPFEREFNLAGGVRLYAKNPMPSDFRLMDKNFDPIMEYEVISTNTINADVFGYAEDMSHCEPKPINFFYKSYDGELLTFDDRESLYKYLEERTVRD